MTSPSIREIPAVRFASGQAGIIAALALSAAVGADQTVALALVTLVTLGYAARLPAGFALGLGLAAWAYYTGFVVNRFGDLTFTTPDLVRLALLLGCAEASHWRR